MILQDNGTYRIDIDDVLNNSEFTQTDLTNIFKEQVEANLKVISQRVNQIMFNAYRGLNKKRQIDFIKWWVEQETSRQNALRDAMIEYLRGVIYSGLDMNNYDGGMTHSETVIDIMRDGDIWFPQTIEYEDDDIA